MGPFSMEKLAPLGQFSVAINSEIRAEKMAGARGPKQ